MKTPYPVTRPFHFNAAASATQTLPEAAVAVLNVQVISGNGTALATDTNYAVVPSGATGSQVDFTGSVGSASATLTFPSALVVTDAIAGEYVPVGAL
jgi:hypothetical protein